MNINCQNTLYEFVIILYRKVKIITRKEDPTPSIENEYKQVL